MSRSRGTPRPVSPCANKPILRRGELVGALAATGIVFALDQSLRNRIRAVVGLLATRYVHRREAKLLLGKHVPGVSLEF